MQYNSQQKSTPSAEQLKRMATRYKGNKLLIVVGVAIILIFIFLTYIYFFSGTGKFSEYLQAARRAEVLKMTSDAGSAPLSGSQKLQILNDFGGNNTSKYDFTPAEREQILRALNGK